MSVTLNGHVYDASQFYGYGYLNTNANTGLIQFPNSIFSDMLAELAASSAILSGGISPSTAGNIIVSDGSLWRRSQDGAYPVVLNAGLTISSTTAQLILNGSTGATSNVEKILFQRGGANKWRLGVNLGGGNVDQFTLFADAAGLNAIAIDASSAAVSFGGAVLWAADASFDIGGSGTGRARDLTISRNAVIGGVIVTNGASTSGLSAGEIGLTNSTAIRSRNAANSGYIHIISVNSSNGVDLGSGAVAINLLAPVTATANGQVITLSNVTSTSVVGQEFSSGGGGIFYIGIDDSTGGSFTGTAYARYLWTNSNLPVIIGVNNAKQVTIASTGVTFANQIIGTLGSGSQAKFTGYSTVGGNSAYAGQIQLGVGGAGNGSLTLQHDDSGQTTEYIDSTYDSTTSLVKLRLRTSGTPVVAMTWGSTEIISLVNFQAQAGFVVGVPTGGYKGTGSINVAADIYKNNTAYTNPDYVFEAIFTGDVVRFIDRPGAEEFRAAFLGRGGKIMTVDEQWAYAKEHYQLPGFGTAYGAFERFDILLQHLEVQVAHTYDLHQRVTQLERRLAA